MIIPGLLVGIGIVLLGAGAIPALRGLAGPFASTGLGLLIATTVLSAYYVAVPHMESFELRVRQSEAPRLLDCLARHPECAQDEWLTADALQDVCPDANCLPDERYGRRHLLRGFQFADGTPGWISAGHLFDGRMPNDIWVKRGDAPPVVCVDSVASRRPLEATPPRVAACEALPFDALPIRPAARKVAEATP